MTDFHLCRASLACALQQHHRPRLYRQTFTDRAHFFSGLGFDVHTIRRYAQNICNPYAHRTNMWRKFGRLGDDGAVHIANPIAFFANAVRDLS